jgi:hypothetical protein
MTRAQTKLFLIVVRFVTKISNKWYKDLIADELQET